MHTERTRARRIFTTIAVAAAAVPMALAAPTSHADPLVGIVDFEGLADGEIVDSLTHGAGISGDPVVGSIGVEGISNDPDVSGNVATVFDEACGGDHDVNTCEPDSDLRQSPFEKLLVLDDVGDTDGDGFVTTPNDSAFGGVFTFDFTSYGTEGQAYVESVTVLDLENKDTSTISLFDVNGELIDTLEVPKTGDGGWVVFDVDVAHVATMEVFLSASGAVGGLHAVPDTCVIPAGAGAAAASSFAARVLDETGDIVLALGDVAEVDVDGIGSDAETKDVTTIDLAGLGTIDVVTNVAAGTVDATTAGADASSVIADVDLLDGAITADAITAVASAAANEFGSTAGTFGSRFEGLRIAGVPVSEAITYDHTIVVPGVGSLGLYERTVETPIVAGVNVGAASVDMIHLTIGAFDTTPLLSELVPVEGWQVFVGHADATAEFGQGCDQPDPPTLIGAASVLDTSGTLVDPVTPVVAAGPIPTAGGGDFAQAFGLTGPSSTFSAALAESEGGFDGVTAAVDSTAHVAGASVLGGSITAGLVESFSTASDAGGSTVVSGSTTIADLVLPLLGDVCTFLDPGAGSTTCTPAPNTVVPVLVPGGDIVTVTLNAQTAFIGGVAEPIAPGGCAGTAGADECHVTAIRIEVGIPPAPPAPGLTLGTIAIATSVAGIN